MSVTFDPAKHCGAHLRPLGVVERGLAPCDTKDCHAPEHACVLAKGYGTEHLRSGNCRYHGGSTPNGKRHGEREAAAKTLASLAIPQQGDPLEVLQAAVESAYGVMLAARFLLSAEPTVDYAVLYTTAIERAARVAKGAVESVSIDRMDKINGRIVDMLERSMERALERAGFGERKREQFRELLREEIVVELAGARN